MNAAESQTSRRNFLVGSGSAALLALSVGAPLSASAITKGVSSAVATSMPVVTAPAFDPAALVADYLKQWMFDPNNPPHPLYPKSAFSGPSSRNYNLKNLQTRRFLQWEHQTVGINLGWTDDATVQTAKKVARWFLTRSTTDRTPLRYGELLGLGNGGNPSFIRYSKRTFGINLDWSNTPVFEWKILGGPIGQPVNSGKWLALYNQKAGDCLIHFDRTVGGDIGWPGSQTWFDQLGDVLTKAVKDHWKEAVALLLKMAV